MSFMVVGCATTTGRLIPKEHVQQVTVGVTTEEEAVSLLGKPNVKSLNEIGRVVLIYQYSKMSMKPSTFIPIIGLLTGGFRAQGQTLTIVIGDDGKVARYLLHDTDMPVSTGILSSLK